MASGAPLMASDCLLHQVHSSDLFHAVTRMTSGVRYSLILFFDPDTVEDQFHTRVAGIKNGRVRRLMAEVFFPSAESSQGVLALSRLLGSG